MKTRDSGLGTRNPGKKIRETITFRNSAASIAFLGAALLLLFAPPAAAVAVIGIISILLLPLRKFDADPRAPEKLLVFAGAFYVAVWLLAAWVHWQAPADAAGYVALVLIYPAWRASRGIGEGGLWFTFGLASVAAAAAAVMILLFSGPIDMITAPSWSLVALACGAISLAAADERRISRRAALIVTGALGVAAALVTGTWAVWLALPVMIVIWFFYLPRRMAWQLRWGALLIVAIGVELVLVVHGTGVLVHFRRLVLQTDVWIGSGGRDGLFGAVLNDWTGALAAFAQHPLIGAGSRAGADLNQYIMTLHDRGLLGAVALALLLILPGRFFLRLGTHGDAARARIGRAGILLVTTYGIAGLIAPVLSDSRTLVFYAFATAVLYAAARQAETRARTQPVKRRQSLSATVIAKNEADRIARCLDSVAGWADEIIVLDSGSNDDTVAIARRYTDCVEITDWPGYGVQKQRALERATCDWVLSLDADEALTPELRHDIDAALDESPACSAYRLPWAVIVYGKRLDFGRSSRAPLRLFKRAGAHFTADVVHETVVPAPGAIGTLEGRLLHYTHRDFGHALDKSARYAWLGAQRRHAKGRRGGGLGVAALRSLWVFLQIYILRGGFLDGAAGFLVAVTYMQGAFNKYAGLWTLRRADRDSGHRTRDPGQE
ncbi:MAG TPA: glycosyltransferase [Gammaproteobacteria bacterium]|nr:glycosyltransferase [Gammaproteobacteria bacterium]